MFGNWTEEAQKVMINAKAEMIKLKHPYVGSEHLLLAILSLESDVTSMLNDRGVTYDVFREKLIKKIGKGSKKSDWFLYTPLLKRVIENATIGSRENNNGILLVKHLFLALLEEGEGIAIRMLLGLDIDLDELYGDLNKRASFKIKKKKDLLVNELGIDLTDKAKRNELDPVIGRESEINRIIEILCRRTKNNPILIGEAGVGKTAIIEELARRIVKNNIPNNLKNKKIIELDMATMVAGTKYRGEFEERIRKVITEIEEDDSLILFIDEVHTLVGAGGAEGAIDASNIFKPALARGKMRCIGATTTSEYKKFIEKDRALDRRFQKVSIEEPKDEFVKEILLGVKDIYEGFHNTFLSDDMINLIIKLSNKYIHDRKQPDASIDILDEVCSRCNIKLNSGDSDNYKIVNKIDEIVNEKNKYISSGEFDKAYKLKIEEQKCVSKLNELEILDKTSITEVTEEDLAEVISFRTGVPVYEIVNGDLKWLNKVEKSLKKKIVGQNEAIEKLINITKRIKMGFHSNDKPYSFLFIGPSGVGKTELTKIYSEALVGSDNLIRLDMSEYSESHSKSKILGATPGYIGYGDTTNILEMVRDNPNAVILLDEIDKAHKSVINLFFQILDEGNIKLSNGNVVNFSNNIIIMTSNIGFNKNGMGFNNDISVKTVLKDQLDKAFLNRIDESIVFNKLDKKQIRRIIKDKLNIVKNKFLEKDIIVEFDNKCIDKIISKCEYNEYGARKIAKIIVSDIEDIIISEFSYNGVKNIHINVDNDKYVVVN